MKWSFNLGLYAARNSTAMQLDSCHAVGRCSSTNVNFPPNFRDESGSSDQLAISSEFGLSVQLEIMRFVLCCVPMGPAKLGVLPGVDYRP